MSYIMTSMVGLFLCCSSLSGLLQRASPFIDSKIADQQVVRAEWTEIKVDKPLERVGDYQEIGLSLTEPHERDLWGPPGIRMPDGSIVLPEVESITSDGRTVEWTYSGSRGDRTLTYRFKDESIQQDYAGIRIRADKEIKLQAIFWTGIVIKNMP